MLILHTSNFFLKFTKLVDLMDTKVDKILHNVKNQVEFNVEPTQKSDGNFKKIWGENALGQSQKSISKAKFEHLLNLQILLDLACILLLLRYEHALIKFVQMQDVFVCDLIITRSRFVNMMSMACIVILFQSLLQTIVGLSKF